MANLGRLHPGKRSSRNAIRHGMTANEHTVLEAELLEEYDEVRSAFRPGNKSELRLGGKIANLDWRLERLAMMDTSLLNLRATSASTTSANTIPVWKASASSSYPGSKTNTGAAASTSSAAIGTFKYFRLVRRICRSV